MDQSDPTSKLRAALSRVRGHGRGRRYSKRLQRRVVEHYRMRTLEGLSNRQIAAELGIPWETIHRWNKELADSSIVPTQSPTFTPVEVLDSAPPVRSTLVVRGPAGLYIEGLDVDALAELVRRLS